MPSLKEKQLELPIAPKPAGFYVPVVSHRNLLYTAGMLPMDNGRLAYTGQVNDQTVEDGQKAARLAVLNALAAVKEELGDLSRVIQVVKLTGYVQCTSGFGQQPQVMNAASELLVDWFGDNGRHARSAVGVASLPLNAMVELELIIAV
jgi:enamine deaminase RidA (YjgF/YER057c/UK114 family)